jgi:hypothetical protein
MRVLFLGRINRKQTTVLLLHREYGKVHLDERDEYGADVLQLN